MHQAPDNPEADRNHIHAIAKRIYDFQLYPMNIRLGIVLAVISNLPDINERQAWAMRQCIDIVLTALERLTDELPPSAS